MAEENKRDHSKRLGDEPTIDMLSVDSRLNEEDEESDSYEEKMNAPFHPVREMQGPFEESITDAARPDKQRQREQGKNLGAKARRQKLLDTNEPNYTYNTQWRASSKSTFHPLTKVVAQIAFGIHLLHQGLAESDEEVVRILQRHVDEVDNFLQQTEEDLDLALADTKERIKYLKLPLEHVNIFDMMLEDKKFRLSIVEGNVRIEQVVNRTTGLMNDSQIDCRKAMESTLQMAKYLSSLEDDWPRGDSKSINIYHTMLANTEGWKVCLSGLQIKANSLGVALVQLGNILNEMAKRAGVASRRSVVPHRPIPSDSQLPPQPQSPPPVSRYSRRMMKSLPEDPDFVTNIVKPTPPGRDVIPFEQRFENPRPRPPTPPSRSSTSTESYRLSNMFRTRPSASRPFSAMSTLGKRASSKPDPAQSFPRRSGRFSMARAEKGSSGRRSSTPMPVEGFPLRPQSQEPLRTQTLPAPVFLPPLEETHVDRVDEPKSQREESLRPEIPSVDSSPEISQKRNKTRESVFRSNFLRNTPEPFAGEQPASGAEFLGSRDKQARGKLQRQSQSALVEKEAKKEKRTREASPFGPDSAYSSGSNTSDLRPTTSPRSFHLFPRTPSMHSLHSPGFRYPDASSEPTLTTALPRMSALQAPNGSSPTIEGSRFTPTATLKKRGSLGALRNFFKREKSVGASNNSPNMTNIYEIPA